MSQETTLGGPAPTVAVHEAHDDERGQGFRLGRHADAVHRRLERWQAEGFGRRLWAKDPSLWSPKPLPELVYRLCWLTLPASLTGTP